MDRLNPSSPYGQERVRRMTPYTSEEKDLLMEELSNLEKLMNKKEDLKQEINHLRRIFMQMKDVRPTIKKAREMCLNDIELFEMKNFLIYSEQARSEANYVNGQTKMTGLGYMDLEAALDILDPDGCRIPSFYIYEAYSEKLDDIRKRKRELEKSMEIAAEETKKEYQNLRHQVVLEEEEEEQIIREQLTKRLQPFLVASLFNANVSGLLYLLLVFLSAIARFAVQLYPTYGRFGSWSGLRIGVELFIICPD